MKKPGKPSGGETGNGAILTPGKIDGAGETVGEASIGGTIF